MGASLARGADCGVHPAVLLRGWLRLQALLSAPRSTEGSSPSDTQWSTASSRTRMTWSASGSMSTLRTSCRLSQRR